MPIEIRNQLLMPKAGMKFGYLDQRGKKSSVEITDVTDREVKYIYTDNKGQQSESKTKLDLWRQFVRIKDQIYKIVDFKFSY